jgi:hypothetical protein
MREPLLERVRKLLALADSANEHEASNAAAAAQRMISRHRLELADLELAADESPRLERQEMDAPEGRCRAWRELLAGAVAEANGCFSYVRRKRVGVPSVVRSQRMLLGSADNVSAAHYLYCYLCREIERLTKAAVRHRFSAAGVAAAGCHAEGKRAWSESFRLGAASAIAERVKAAAECVTTIEGTSTALAVIAREAEALRAEIEAMNPEPAPQLETTSEAYNQGRTAGETVELTIEVAQLEEPANELPEG